MEETRRIAELAVSYKYDDLPDDVRKLACLALLDNLGCAIRGASEPLAKILSEELVGQSVHGASLVTGQPIASTPHNHATIYAAAAHAIDFDDTSPSALGAHTGSAVIGAVMAQLPHQKVSGKELIAAIVAGYETVARVGALLETDHYLNGFHSTATIGVFGAAAAAGRLMNFNVSQMQQAFGLAATQAAGLKCVFGTMTKPFNASHSASSGLLGARLVSCGFTSTEEAIEAPKGYLDMFLGKPESERHVAPQDEFAIRTNAFKFHAACHATHPMIEALQSIQNNESIDHDAIEEVVVKTSELGMKTASIGKPETGLECKFSYSHVAAATLFGADMAADVTYSEEMLNTPAVADLRERVEITPSAEDPFITEVKIKLKTGEEFDQYLNFYDLMKDTDLVGERLKEKFVVNASPALGSEKSKQLQNAILDISSCDDVRAMLAA